MPDVTNSVLESLWKANREQSANEIEEYITRTVISYGVTSIEEISDDVMREALLELSTIQQRLRGLGNNVDRRA